MANSSNIRLFNTIQWAKKLNFGRDSSIGTSQEPALTSANIVMQTVVGPPFAWRWNRVVTGFICTAGQQDYSLFNWVASLDVELGWLTVDDAGNSQQVTIAGETGSSMPTWNHTLGGTTTDNSVVYTNLGPIGVNNASQCYRFGWIETSSVNDIHDSNKWKEMTSHICLGVDSTQGRPLSISAQGDNGANVITFRLMPVPDVAYPVVITIQQKPLLFSNTGQTWGPIPDEYSHIYNWGFVSLMWMFADDPRFQQANSKFVSQLLGANQGLSDTERNIFLNNWQQITGQPISNNDRQTQGYQARGV